MENFGGIGQSVPKLPNPIVQEVDNNRFIESTDALMDNGMPADALMNNGMTVDALMNNGLTADALMNNGMAADALINSDIPADIDIFAEMPGFNASDFPFLDDLVDEVIGGDVRNLDKFNDTVLAGKSNSGVQVQSAVPYDETVLRTPNQPLDNTAELNVDVPKVNASVAQLTPVVLVQVLDGQMLNNPIQLQMPQQNGVYGIPSIAHQGVPFFTLPAQTTVCAGPSTLAAVNENAVVDAGTAAEPSQSSHKLSPGSSKRKQAEDSESASASKKQKLYEAPSFADPVMEKKRQNAINAKNHRDKTKHIIKDLEQKVAEVTQDRDHVAQERDDSIAKAEELRGENEELKRQNEELREQIEDLKKKLQKAARVWQIIQQQRKCGVPQGNILDFLHQ